MVFCYSDCGNEDEGGRADKEEACAEESETIRGAIAPSSPGLQQIDVRWLQSKPQDSQERGGEGTANVFLFGAIGRT